MTSRRFSKARLTLWMWLFAWILSSNSLKQAHTLCSISISDSPCDSSSADTGHSMFLTSKKNAGSENVSSRLWKRKGAVSLIFSLSVSLSALRFLDRGLADLPRDFDGHFKSGRDSNRSIRDWSCLPLEIRSNRQLALASFSARRICPGSEVPRNAQIRAAKNSSCRSTSQAVTCDKLNISCILAQLSRL